MNHFSPFQYRNKKTIYVKIPNKPGICTVWDWSKVKSKYVKREGALKYYAFKKVQGRQVSKSFDSLNDAQSWRSSSDAIHDEFIENESTFKEVRELCFRHEREKKKLRHSTLETYESNCKHLMFFDSLFMSEITSNTVDQWLVSIKKPEYLALQNKTRITYRHELSVLRRILKYYSDYICDTFNVPIKKRHWDDCIVNHEKHKLAKDKNRTNFIPRAEFEKFLSQLEKHSGVNPKVQVYGALAEFQLGTGVRIGEACALEWKDVNFSSKSAIISKTVQWARKKDRPTVISPLTKTSESRTVFLTQQALLKLKQWQMICGRRNGLIFSFDGVQPVQYRCIQHYFDSAFEALGLKWRSTHILRHSFATDFLEKTGNKTALQGQLGHATSKQTEHYAKVTAEAVKHGILEYDLAINSDQNRKDFGEENPVSFPLRLGEAGK